MAGTFAHCLRLKSRWARRVSAHARSMQHARRCMWETMEVPAPPCNDSSSYVLFDIREGKTRCPEMRSDHPLVFHGWALYTRRTNSTQLSWLAQFRQTH